MDLETDAGRLLDQLDVLRHASDLDLLIFFARHPRSLLSSEQIAAFLGYSVTEVAGSLELLLEAGFLTRTPNPRHVARMYLLAATPPGDGWLSAVKRLATTRRGRLALIGQIRRRSSDARGSTQRGASADTVVPPPLQFPRGRAAMDDSPQNENVAAPRAPSEPKTQSSGRSGGR